MDDPIPAAAPGDADVGLGPRRTPLVAAGLLAAAAIVAAAVVIVGPAPRPADEGLPEAPPPLALPADAAEGGPLARAAAQLAAGQLDAARAGFTDVVAEDRDGVPGQVGLVLSRWRTTGPRSVERDLTQLSREYPEDAFVALHLGLVRTVLEDERAARAALRDARELGHDAADETSLRMARLADDLLHPDAFRGPMPVLVAPIEVAAADRARLRGLLAAVAAGDRRRIGVLAPALAASDDGLSRVAAVAAGFDKADPAATVDRLDAIAGDPGAPLPARDRARMLAALGDAWGGGDRDDACTGLRRAARAPTDPGTRRLAGPISGELCS